MINLRQTKHIMIEERKLTGEQIYESQQKVLQGG